MVGYGDPCPCCGNKKRKLAALERWPSCPEPRQGTPSPAKFARSFSDPMPSLAPTSLPDGYLAAAGAIPVSCATNPQPPPTPLPSSGSASVGRSIGNHDVDLLNRSPPCSSKTPEAGMIRSAAHHQPPPPTLPAGSGSASLGVFIGDRDPDLPNPSPISSKAPDTASIRPVDSDACDGYRSPDSKIKINIEDDLEEGGEGRKEKTKKVRILAGGANVTKVRYQCQCGSATEVVLG